MSWKDRFREVERRDETDEEELYDGTLYAYYRGMKWWKTIGEGFKILGKTYLPTVLIFLGLAIIFSLIATLSMTEWNWTLTVKNAQVDAYIILYGLNLQDWPVYAQEFYNAFAKQIRWNNMVNLFIQYFSLVIGGVLTSHYILEKAKGNDNIKLLDSIKQTFRGSRIGVIVLTTLVLSVLTSAGFSFFVIFGFVILIMVGLCIPTLIDTDFSFKDTLNNGFQLGKDFRLRTTILVIISVAFFSFFGNYLAAIFFPNFSEIERISWLDPLTRNWGMLFYVDLINYLSMAAFQPIVFSFLAVHYLELTVQKKASWFNWAPLTKKEPLEIQSKDFPNIIVFAIITLISLVVSAIIMLERFF
jgi:hypothetical protein